VTIAGVARDFNITTIACDTTPTHQRFQRPEQCAVDSVRTSNTITVSGINGPTPVSIAGGEYSIGCTGTFTNLAGTVNNNQTICLRQTAAATADTVTTAVVSVGPLTASFRVFTAAAFDLNAEPQVFSATRYGVRTDGALFSWTGGGNPQERGDIGGVKRFAPGGGHALAVRSDGVVWTWNTNVLSDANNFGQLGDGSTTASTIAKPIAGVAGVTDVAAGLNHSLALVADGTVWAWGHNAFGQVGDGTTTTRLAPVALSGLGGVTRVAGGPKSNHSLALKNDGTVWAWGSNSQSQLGDGTTTSRSVPMAVSSLGNVVASLTGELHSLCVKGDGNVWALASNPWANWATAEHQAPTPVMVLGLNGV
jgi:hypothetical protein